ncbi:MAG: FHA domain-containing protein [Actinomycetota bacterium]|nr:FHA domain-containing protein [Geodermatophilaceae bacterium]MDQ3505647.1 FHA domain-containing protein [Actinomycetota bacterium]
MSQRCEVQSGPGLVARGAGVVWIGPDCDREFAEVLVSCAQLTGAGSAGVLSAVATNAPNNRGSFAVAVPNGSSWTAMWRGDGRVHDGDQEVDGRPASGSWLAASFGGNAHIAVGSPPRGSMGAGTSAGLAELTDLRAGVVPGGGALLIAEAFEPVRPPDRHDYARPSTTGTGSSFAPASAAAAEAAPMARDPEPDTSGGAAASTDAGQASTQMWSAATPTPQLLFDDGRNLAIDNDLVLGRRPENHDLVRSGGARPIAIEDSQNVLSSAHAAIQVRGSEVYLLDLGSLNGTHIASASATEWTRLDSGVARRLEEGDRLLLGWTIITFATGPQA